MGNKQLIILFIGYFLAACTIEVQTILEPTPGEDGKVPVSVEIVFNSGMQSRADGWEYDSYFPVITDEEKTVSNVLIVVFKDNLLEQYKYFPEEEILQNPGSSVIEIKNGEENVIELNPGIHYFYAIANIPDELYDVFMEVLEGQEDILHKDTFERGEINVVSAEYMTGDGVNFIMTNLESPSIRVIYSKEQQKNPSNHNNVSIKIGRAVAKISLAYVASEINTGELHGALSNIKYRVFNKPARMYYMPVVENDILITPHYTSYPTGYFTPTVKDDVDVNNIDNNEQWLSATTPDNLVLGSEYCFENNNKTPLKSNSTMLLIKAVFTPAVWLDAEGNKVPAPSGSNNTFYRIGLYNSSNELTVYVQGYFIENPVSYIQTLTNALSDLNKPRYSYKAVEYKDGICYYGFWPTGTAGQDVIRRNDFYRVAITHVHGAGYPGPGGVVDPDVDPDEVATLGRIAVYLANWNDDDRIIIIGDDEYEDPLVGGSINPGPWTPDEQDKELGGGSQWD